MSDALTAFVLARIAETEQLAREASPGPWRANAEGDEVVAVDDVTVADGFALSGQQLRATVAHIVHHDPARVLAECEAKWRIVELHKHRRFDVPDAYSGATVGCDVCHVWAGGNYAGGWCATLRLLALPDAAHPDWREEWRPRD